MTVTFGLLLLPAVRGLNVPWSYDSLTSLKSNYPAPCGTEMVQRHWPTGETAPVTVLAVADRPYSPDAWAVLCNRLIAGVRTVPDVGNIRGLAAPLGLQVKPAENAGVLLLAHDKVAGEFLSPDGRAMRLSVVLTVAPLSSAALDDVSKIAVAANGAMAAANFDAHIHLTGASAEMIDIRDVTHRDFLRIAVLALAVILIVVIAALRDVPLAVFMLAATLLSYFTTLGLTLWTFQFLGAHQLEWKVQMMLFIVLVAVGQDYSIFFAVRYEQEVAAFAAERGGRAVADLHRAGDFLVRFDYGRDVGQHHGGRHQAAGAGRDSRLRWGCWWIRSSCVRCSCRRSSWRPGEEPEAGGKRHYADPIDRKIRRVRAGREGGAGVIAQPGGGRICRGN